MAVKIMNQFYRGIQFMFIFSCENLLNRITIWFSLSQNLKPFSMIDIWKLDCIRGIRNDFQIQLRHGSIQISCTTSNTAICRPLANAARNWDRRQLIRHRPQWRQGEREPTHNIAYEGTPHAVLASSEPQASLNWQGGFTTAIAVLHLVSLSRPPW